MASTGDICPEALDLDTLAGELAGLGLGYFLAGLAWPGQACCSLGAYCCHAGAGESAGHCWRWRLPKRGLPEAHMRSAWQRLSSALLANARMVQARTGGATRAAPCCSVFTARLGRRKSRCAACPPAWPAARGLASVGAHSLQVAAVPRATASLLPLPPLAPHCLPPAAPAAFCSLRPSGGSMRRQRSATTASWAWS